jgi:2,3-dihydroxy-p-cumate/2,3-dihydroxybenzoate 3,4-dioxygenase
MIRIEKLGYVELNVTDVERSVRFYRDMVGLEFIGTRSDGGALLRCDDQDEYSLVLHQKDLFGFKRVGWMLEDDTQFGNVSRRLNERNIAFEELELIECSVRGISRAMRAVEPFTGAVMEFYRAVKHGDELRPYAASHTKIQRLGHVVFSTPDARNAVSFLRDVLDFRESDSIGEAATFLRPFPNPFHHGIGIMRRENRVFNHLNFMVTDIDDIGRAYNRLKKAGVPIVFGPGRHPASTSIFLYFLDPDGMTLEYSFGMEEFEEVDPRQARTLVPAPENFDTWGSVRDARMGSMGSIEASSPQAK